MRLTRREALARGGGLFAALGLGKLLPSPAAERQLEQAPAIQDAVEEVIGYEVLEHEVLGYDWADSLVYTLQGQYGGDWVDLATMVCKPGYQPHFSRDIVPPDVRYVRVRIETT